VTKQSINIPDLGHEKPVDVIELSVKVGDSVEKDQVLLVMESDKATIELNAPFEGKICQVFIKKGDQVKTGQAAFELEVVLASQEKTSIHTAPSTTAPSTTEPKPTQAESRSPEPIQTTNTPEKIHLPAPFSVPTPSQTTSAIPQALSASFAYAGPAVRKLANDLGVDLNQLTGSGPHQRILKEDVHLYVKEKMQTQGASPTNAVFSWPNIDFTQWGEIEKRSLSSIQKTSAERLLRNWQHIPHVTQFDTADITDLEQFRKKEAEKLTKQPFKLTFLTFLVKAVSYTLKAFPKFNASFSSEKNELILKKYIHIGIAVDTPYGLVVPVIKNADQASLLDIAKTLQTLSEKARDKKLLPDEMQGGTFTISSLGGIGGSAFTPIINWPEVAILGVSRAELKPVFTSEGNAPESQWAARLMLPLSLSYDHRVIDGADAARFTTTLCANLNDLRRCLL